MRIFISDVREPLSVGADQSRLARELLRWGVREVWGCDMPDIERVENGKPYFVGAENMHFSLSHTKTHVLAALSDGPVGADAETLRPVKKEHERLFSAEMLKNFGYFGGWTLREAVFKLVGSGSLRSMEIGLEGGRITTGFDGVRCKLYMLPDCAVAVADYSGNFPENAEIIECSKFWPADA